MLLHYYHSDAKNKNIIVHPRSHTFMKFKIMYHLNHLIYTTQNSLKKFTARISKYKARHGYISDKHQISLSRRTRRGKWLICDTMAAQSHSCLYETHITWPRLKRDCVQKFTSKLFFFLKYHIFYYRKTTTDICNSNHVSFILFSFKLTFICTYFEYWDFGTIIM